MLRYIVREVITVDKNVVIVDCSCIVVNKRKLFLVLVYPVPCCSSAQGLLNQGNLEFLSLILSVIVRHIFDPSDTKAFKYRGVSTTPYKSHESLAVGALRRLRSDLLNPKFASQIRYLHMILSDDILDDITF